MAAPLVPETDEVLWQAWQAMELPENYRAEIIEGAIEVWSIGPFPHARTANRLWEALGRFLRDVPDGTHVAWNVMAVTHGRSAWIPDGLVAPEDLEPYVDEDDLGVDASAVQALFEVVSPGRRNQDRDRVRKRREYARAGIPVYVLIDDYDDQGTVTLFTCPRPDEADWEDIHRVPYGTDVTIPEGPAKGFVIGEAITGQKRG